MTAREHALRRRPDLARAARLFDRPPITRFAPSPTGYLHAGHVVNAVYVWGLARALGGSVVLRIEDHDRIRSRPGFEAAILEDLAWLGFIDAPIAGPPRTPNRQSDRPQVYADALEALRRTGRVYACDCSRTRIGTGAYPGRCRERRLPDGPGRSLRVALGDGQEHFHDLLLGDLAQTPAAQCGDIVVRDRDRNWTYQFAVVVDDLREGISLVVRGVDLLDSTGRQLALRRLLQGGSDRPPTYLHHPLLLDEEGRKLSKSTGSAGVRSMRQRGMSPAEVIGRAAADAGLLEPGKLLTAQDVHELFTRVDPA